MFPFPVRALNEKDAELHNQEKFEKLPTHIKKNIIKKPIIISLKQMIIMSL